MRRKVCSFKVIRGTRFSPNGWFRERRLSTLRGKPFFFGCEKDCCSEGNDGHIMPKRAKYWCLPPAVEAIVLSGPMAFLQGEGRRLVEMDYQGLKSILQCIFVENDADELYGEYIRERSEKELVYRTGFVRGKLDNVLLHHMEGDDIDQIAAKTGMSSSTIGRWLDGFGNSEVDEVHVYGMMTPEEQEMVDSSAGMLYEDCHGSYVDWLMDWLSQHYGKLD
jgi:hypothetical protein